MSSVNNHTNRIDDKGKSQAMAVSHDLSSLQFPEVNHCIKRRQKAPMRHLKKGESNILLSTLTCKNGNPKVVALLPLVALPPQPP